MLEKKGAQTTTSLINLECATRDEWKKVWSALNPILFDEKGLLQWQQFLETQPTLEQVRIKRAGSGIPVHRIEFEELDKTVSYPVSKQTIGMNPRTVISQMFPALNYTFTPSGQLLILSDDHIGATQTKLALHLGVLNLNDAPFEEENIDAHHDRGYYYYGQTTIDTLAREEYGVWRKILEGNGFVKEDLEMRRWLNNPQAIEAASEYHIQIPLDLCFFDFDLVIPAQNPQACKLGISFQSVQQPLVSLLRRAKVINISTSTGNFSDQSKIPQTLAWVKNAVR